MNLILFMVFMAMLLSFIFVVAYLWSLSSGQFDDLDTPALRILKNDFTKKTEQKGKLNE